MPGWSGRVGLVPGNSGYAFVPGEMLIEVSNRADLGGIAALLGRRVIDPGEEPPYIEGSVSIGRDYAKIEAYDGDVPSAMRRLRGAGFTAQPNHVYFADTNADSLSGNPVYGHPVYGNPVYGHPAYGNPVYGHPVYGHSATGDPVYGHPVYGHPVYGHPVYGHPVYGHAGANAAAYASPCPGGPHCCDTNPCTCVQPRGAGSLVYPHPVFARAVYSEQAALSYEFTGVRPNNALPLFPPAAVELPANAAWEDGVIRVAVVDTGWPTAEFGGIAPDLGEDVPDFEGDEYLDPVAGHGMFIARLILQYAPGASVKVVKALSTYGDGAEDVICNQIDDLITNNDPNVDPEDFFQPHVISLSFGTYAPDLPERLSLSIAAAIGAGIVVVASAGNDGTSRKQYPAAYTGVVSVGALGPDGPASFSNWGDWVRACAPGVDVASGFWIFDGKAAGVAAADRDKYEGWALWSGTSFAAPIVAAALAQTMQRGAGFQGYRAVEQVIDHPRLYRLPCYGTVINPPPTMPLL